MICQQITANTKVEANHLANKYAREYNLQCTIEKLFAGAFGIGYPPEDAERKIQDTLLLK